MWKECESIHENLPGDIGHQNEENSSCHLQISKIRRSFGAGSFVLGVGRELKDEISLFIEFKTTLLQLRHLSR